jgi:fatty-acyl-CoA synthase
VITEVLEAKRSGYSDYQLTIDKILRYGLFIAPDQKIIYAPAGLPRKEYTYAEYVDRVNKLGTALEKMGVNGGEKPWEMGSRVAVMEWNTSRYQELLYAVPMYGAVVQTVNIRLAPKEQIYTMTVAKPEVLFINSNFLSGLKEIIANVPSIKKVVIMDDRITCTGEGKMPEVSVPAGTAVYEYESLLESSGQINYPWPDLNEYVVASFFFTSGTTGLPKGVYHTHRQISLACLQNTAAQTQDPIKMTNRDILLMYVPYFHVLGWGIPYTGILMGQKMVFPGRYVWDHMARLILEFVEDAKKVNGRVVAAGVPTMLYSTLQELKKSGVQKVEGFSYLYGGSALPVSIYEDAKKMGIEIATGYGPTETGMTGLTRMMYIPRMWMKMGVDCQKMADYFVTRNSLGVPIPFSFVKTVSAEGEKLPEDGKTRGRLLMYSPAITREYYQNPEATERAWRSGYFDLDDVAVIDRFGTVLFEDREKDVIKSGGEWIPSARVEGFISTHPSVGEVAVLGVYHPVYVERPVALVALKGGAKLTEEELKDYLMVNYVNTGIIPKYWVPDKILFFADELPKTSTGKINKVLLRDKYKDAAV